MSEKKVINLKVINLGGNETTVLLDKARQILKSSDEIDRQALKSSILGLHRAMMDRAKLHRLLIESKILKAQVEAIMKELEAIKEHQKAATGLNQPKTRHRLKIVK